LLTDSDRKYHPCVYEAVGRERHLRVEFQLAKLIYFEDKREEQQKITRADNAAKLNQALDRMIFASSKDDVLKELD
jgi:hypothetical protein